MNEHEHDHPSPETAHPQKQSDQESRKPQAEKPGQDHAQHDGMAKPGQNHEQHKGGAAHDHKKMIADYRKRFFIVLILTIPILILSPMTQGLLSVDWQFPGSNWIEFVLATTVYLYGGYPFLRGFFQELKERAPGMMVLIAIAITAAYLYGAAAVSGLGGMDFFWELSTLILVMLLGHWMEMKSIAGASRELELLVQLMPDQAHLIADGGTKDVRTDTLKENDRILIKPGEKIAADGTVSDGESYVNESLLTGESKPVKKGKGAKLIAGSINGEGSLTVTVSHSSKDSYLSKVIQLVDEAQRSKSKTQLLADRAAQILTIIALVAGSITLAVWMFAGEPLSFALERMVTVIVISCPHALGLAVPLVVAISTALAARHGLLIKNRNAFENSRKITAIIFDKTGTLTYGKFEVSRVVSVQQGVGENDILRLAASLEKNSQHPIAAGILEKAKASNIQAPDPANFQSITGKGVEADVDWKHIHVVGPGYLKEKNIGLPQDFQSTAAETIVFVLINDALAGYIALADKIREESAPAIETLHQAGIKCTLLTGDNDAVAKSVSEQLKMDGYFAQVLPHEKLDKVKELQAKGEFVAMTGDGVNDAPALAQADIGIAVGSGSDIAAETAGIILVNSNPKDIASLIMFGKATHRKMIQNLLWATGYNVVALPLAAGVLYYSTGILLSPALAAVFMSVSTIIVAINAKMLKI